MTQPVVRRWLASDDAWPPLSVRDMASHLVSGGWANRVEYSLAKGGVVALARSPAVEWAPLGIRVNGVAPTFIHAPLVDDMPEDGTFKAEVMRRLPFGRVGESDGVAHAVVHLARSGADMATGYPILVDGSRTAQ